MPRAFGSAGGIGSRVQCRCKWIHPVPRCLTPHCRRHLPAATASATYYATLGFCLSGSPFADTTAQSIAPLRSARPHRLLPALQVPPSPRAHPTKPRAATPRE